MSYKCEYCQNLYSSKQSMKNHQKTANKCIEIQNSKSGINIISLKYNCEFCKKSFSSKKRLQHHQSQCSEMFKEKLKQKDAEIKYFENVIYEKNEIISNNNNNILTLEIENKILKQKNDQTVEKESQKNLKELQEKLQEIALAAIEQKNDTISNMIKKYVKKQPRKQFKSSNVIYILTTPSLQKDRRYILGKAKNLTNRLSTYNKTDEHEVIFFQDCGDEETMNILEPTVFKKLNEYREQANRERFILPEDKNIDFFIDTIKNCFEFLK